MASPEAVLPAKEFETAVVWFRRDLRVDDNPALLSALQSATNVVSWGRKENLVRRKRPWPLRTQRGTAGACCSGNPQDCVFAEACVGSGGRVVLCAWHYGAACVLGRPRQRALAPARYALHALACSQQAAGGASLQLATQPSSTEILSGTLMHVARRWR